MSRIALFPGTFDPITLGHTDVINRALPLFDKLVIGIGSNSAKKPMFSEEQRKMWIKKNYKDHPQIEVQIYSGLTIDFCRAIGAQFILRGIRYVSDFEYEKAIGDMNKTLAPEIESVFLACSPQFSTISSTLVRDVIRNNGAAHIFLPKEVQYEK